jgi:stage IV sporulation protein FB
MQDPFNWSIPCGRLFGITIRVHILFPVVALALVLRFAFEMPIPGAWIDLALLQAILFLTVLLHEFGHCFGARAVNGDAQEILMWPLGGLAFVDIPHTPRAHFITVICGPAVNLVLGVGALLLLWLTAGVQPHFWFDWMFRNLSGEVTLKLWGGGVRHCSPYDPLVLLHYLWWSNYFLFMLNVFLPGFPLDGGRIAQCIAWKYVGYRRGTLLAVYLGFIVMFVVGLFAIVTNEVMALCLALFIYFSCKQQWIILETGGEDSLFGYDFSQGYTSLERDEAPTAPPKRKKSWWQRWLERRREAREKRAEETRIAEERRLDELLDKVHREGMSALTDEERRFMKRASDRYRNRPHP